MPQLYWEFGHKLVGYEILSEWWAKHAYGRQMYIGQGVYRAMEPKSYAWHNKKELPNQIKRLREFPQLQGSVYFSSKTFNSNPNGWSDSLRNNYYKYPAIAPPMPWIDSIKPEAPVLVYDSSKPTFYTTSLDLYFRQDDANDLINRYVIYQFDDVSRINKEDPKNIKEIIVSGREQYLFDLQKIAADQNRIIIAATSLTNTNNESGLSQFIYLERKGNGWQVVSK